MRLAADIAGGKYRVIAKLPLNGERVLLRIWAHAAGFITGQTGDGQERRPIDVRVGIASGRIQRWKVNGKALKIINSRRCGNERIRKKRRRGAGVCAAIRRIARHDACRYAFNGREETAEAHWMLVLSPSPNSARARPFSTAATMLTLNAEKNYSNARQPMSAPRQDLREKPSPWGHPERQRIARPESAFESDCTFHTRA